MSEHVENPPREELLRDLPRFAWARPIRYVTEAGEERHGCRLCMAARGASGRRDEWLFSSRAAHEAHVREKHPELREDAR